MKYFILEQNQENTDLPRIINWYQNDAAKAMNKGEYAKVPRRTLLNLYENPNTVFADVITQPFLLITKTIKDVFLFYDKNIAFRQFVLLDGTNNLTELYFAPVLKKIDCFTYRKQSDKCTSVSSILNASLVGKTPVFRAIAPNTTLTIINLDLAESILKRTSNINLKELIIKEDRHE